MGIALTVSNYSAGLVAFKLRFLLLLYSYLFVALQPNDFAYRSLPDDARFARVRKKDTRESQVPYSHTYSVPLVAYSATVQYVQLCHLHLYYMLTYAFACCLLQRLSDKILSCAVHDIFRYFSCFLACKSLCICFRLKCVARVLSILLYCTIQAIAVSHTVRRLEVPADAQYSNSTYTGLSLSYMTCPNPLFFFPVPLSYLHLVHSS